MGKASGLRQRAKTHCPRKHPYDEENTIRSPKGHRSCRKCKVMFAKKVRPKVYDSMQ